MNVPNLIVLKLKSEENNHYMYRYLVRDKENLTTITYIVLGSQAIDGSVKKFLFKCCTVREDVH